MRCTGTFVLGLLLSGFLHAEVFAAGRPAPEVPTATVELFNGKDFSGWTFCMKDAADPAKTWTVTNGVIHCTGKPTGYLRSENTFRDYHLTVEWRFVKVAPKADNTGVLVHIQSPDQVWPKCVQCQGKHTAQGDLFLMAGAESREHQGQDANTALPKYAVSSEKPVGEWNLCEMVCRGDRVQAFINGKFMNQTTECTVTSGAVGIQSEGAELEIRKIIVTPLKADRASRRVSPGARRPTSPPIRRAPGNPA